MAFGNLTEQTLDESLKMLAYYFSRTDSSTFSMKQPLHWSVVRFAMY